MNRTKEIKIGWLFNEFRRYNFVGNEREKCLIETIELTALSFPYITTWDIDNLNNKILIYMVSKNEKEYSKYISYLYGSKLIKQLNLNHSLVEAKADKRYQELEDLLNEIEQIKHKTMATKKVS